GTSAGNRRAEYQGCRRLLLSHVCGNSAAGTRGQRGAGCGGFDRISAGLSPFTERVAEIHRSIEAGAQEIDVVITRAHVFGGRWQALYDEIAAFKQACGPAHLKVILGAGDLLTLRNVTRASFVAMMAGA